MSIPSKKRLEKKKKHEREDRKRLLKRREKIRAEAKSDKERWRLERDTRIKQQPFVKEPKPHARTPEEVAAQIEENYRALQALEQAYEVEASNRECLNKALEEEGFTTLREKMDFLNQQAQAEAQVAIEKQTKRTKSSEDS